MLKLGSTMLIAVAVLLAACGSTPSPVDDGTPKKVDETDTRIAQYVNGGASVPNYVPLHSGLEVGQYWELASEQGGVTTTRRWQISAMERNVVVVEYRTRVDGALVEADYVIAFTVDSARPAGQPNVWRAWIGKPGQVGVELNVPPGGAAADSDARMSREAFSDLEVAGGRWSGTLYTKVGDGWEEKKWVADNGWFGGVVRMESGSSLAQLSAFGLGAEQLLEWD